MSNTILSTHRLAAGFFAAILAIGCGGGAPAAETEPAGEGSAETTAGAENETMTLDAFAAELARQAAPQLCDAPDAPLRACFEVDETQCAHAFTVAMTECANQLRSELPASVDAASADAVALPISQCAGQAYRLGLDQNGLVRQTPECQPQPAG